MFEGIVVDVLLKYLGEYIKDLNKEQLKIGLFSGNVVLKDLEVKGEALDSFNLPVTVKKGVLGKLELRVPWKNLKTQPVVVLLDNIFILVEKQNQFEYDEEEATRRKRNRKKKRLENYEAMSEIKEVKDEKDKKAKSFSEKLVTKILDNLQILINKIHIRFEDEHEERTFALGLTIDRISLQSTDDQWKPTFVENITSTVIMKLVELSDLSIYMDTGIKSLRTLNHSQFYDTFSKLIPTSQNPQGHQYLIKPISAWLKLTLANNRGKVDMEIPKATISAALEELSLSLEEAQYHALLDLLESINFYVQETKYLKFRPKERPTKDPRAWWRYAGNVVIEKIKERLNRKSWSYLLQRSKLRQEYIQLYKSSTGVKWHPALTKPQAKRLEELDDINTFEDIVFFRSLAKAELSQEAQNAERRAEFKKLKRKSKRRSKIISALFSSDDKKKSSKHKDKESKETKDSPDISSPSEKRLSIQLDKEQKKELKKKEKEEKKEEKKREKEDKKRDLKNKLKSLGSPIPLSASRLSMHYSEFESPRLGKGHFSDSASEISDTSSQVTRSEMDSDEEADDVAVPGILLSPQEKQVLYETIGFDQTIAGVMDEKLPPEYIKTKMNIDVGRVSFSLIGKKPDNTVGPLAVFGINDIEMSLEKRPENMLLNLTVDNIEATDMLIANPRYSRLIAPSKKRLDNYESGQENSKFIQFRFEKNPLDGHCDLAIYAKMSPLDIIVNASSVVHFYTFFRPPQPVAVWALAGKGKRQWHDIKQRTRHQLMDVIKNRNTIDLTVDARAPTIFIPADSNQPDTVVAIADLGKILITSELPNSNRKDLDMDNPDENAFYDKFRFSVSGIRVLATTENDTGWQDPSNDNYALYDFVHTDVNLLMEKSINPHDTSLTQMKLSGDLPLLRVHFSTRKLDLVVQLANALDVHLAPLRDMAGGFKTHSMLDDKTKTTKVKTDVLTEMVSGIEDEEEREQVKQQLIAQKQVEVKFSITSVEVELCQTTDEDKDLIIAKLKLVGLSLDLIKQMYSLHGEVLVHGLQLQDFVTQTNNSKFKNLIYSSEQLNAKSGSALIKGSFLKLDQNSPDFHGALTTLSFTISSLYMAVNPPAIVTIMSLVNDCIAATTQRIVTEPPSSPGQSPLVPTHIVHDVSSRVNLLTKVKIDITMDTVAILLNAGNTHLATFSIGGIDLEVDVKEDKTMGLTGGVRVLSLVDETAIVASRPHSHILKSDDLDGDACVTIGFFKLPPPPPLNQQPNQLLQPHARLVLFASHLNIAVNEGFLLQLIAFSVPLLNLLPGRAVAAAIPRNDSSKKPKTYNTLVSPFQKKDAKKAAPALVAEKRRTQLDIKAESIVAFLPENDQSKNGLLVEIPSATLVTNFKTIGAPLLDLDLDDDEEDEQVKELIVTLTVYEMAANRLELHLINVDEAGKETRTLGIGGMDAKMGMEFIVGDVTKPVSTPSKTIEIEIPLIKLNTNPEKMGIIFRGIMRTADFSKTFTVAFNKKPQQVVRANSLLNFTPPASPILGHSNPSTPRNAVTPIRGTPSRNHLALLNKLAIKIGIKVDAIQVGADQNGEIFSEVELKTMLLTIEIKETRHVIVLGKLTHMQVFDTIAANIDGKLVPRRETVVVEQKLGDPILEFNVSKKRDQAAYVDLQVRPLFATLDVDYFARMLTFVLPLAQSFRYHKNEPELPSMASASSFSSARPALMPRVATARDLDRSKSGTNLMSSIAAPSPPHSPSPIGLTTPKAIRPSGSKREGFANERTSSVPQLPTISSPLRGSLPLPSPRAPKQKSFFRLRVENTVAMISVKDTGTLSVEVGTLLVFNEMVKSTPSTPGRLNKSQDEDDVAHEIQVEQVRKLVVRTTHVSARVCETLNARSPAEMTGRGGYVLKDAQFEVSVEAREADNDKTGTVPRRKIILQSSELIFMVTQFDYNLLMTVADGLLKSLVRKAKPPGTHPSSDSVDSLASEILIDVPDLQVGAKGETTSIALLRLNGINFHMRQYASKTMKLEAFLNSINVIDTRPGICNEFSGLIHGKPNNTKPMIKFDMHRVPDTGVLNITFFVDHLRMYANMLAFLEIMDFFLPALTEKLLPNFTGKKEVSAAPKKSTNRILSVTADVSRLKIYVLSDYSKLTSGILAVTTDAALEFVDRNRDAKISLRLQNLHMGTVHHQISSQKASVLHSASVDFVMSNSQGTATSITLSLDTLPLFLSPQDVSPYNPGVRPAIPQLKSKFKNIKKSKEEKAVKELVEKEEVLVVSCIGGIILTAMNDHMGRALPMAEIRITQISAQISNWSAKRLELEVNAALLVEYFNSSIMAFEPLIEKWPLCLTLQQSNNPKFTLGVKSKGMFNLNVTHACGQMLINSYDVVAAVAAQAAKIFKKKKRPTVGVPPNSSSASLFPSPSYGSLPHVGSGMSLHSVASSSSISSDMLDESAQEEKREANSTPTARDAPSRHPAHLLARINGAAARSGTPPPVNSPPSAASPLMGAQPLRKLVSNFHPYWIYNQTGYSISYITEDERKADEVVPSRLGDRLRFPMENVGKNTGRNRNFRQSEEENSLHMTVKIPYDSSPIRRVPIDTLGSYFFRAGNNMQERMCCEVSWNDDGSKNVTVRSCVVVRNFTDVPLEFRISQGPDVRTLGPQTRGECFALPVQLAKGQLMIRPSNGNFRTNDTLSLAELQEAIENDNYNALPPSKNLNLADLLDKTSSASIENKLLGLMNKTGLTYTPEKEEISITRTITCISQAKVPHLFVLQITRGPAFNNNSSERQMYINISKTIHLYPPLILENSLPYAIQFSDPNNQIVIDLDSGAESPISYGIQPKKNVVFFLTGIPNFPTSKHVLINYETVPPTFPQKLRLVDTSHTHAPLDLQLFIKEEAPGVYKITVYSSSWLINNTQMPLLYKVPKVYEITDASLGLAPGQTQRIDEQVDEKPFLYAYDKLKIQVPGSTWSKKFSIDTVGKIVVVQMFTPKGSSEHTEFRFRVAIRFGEGKFQRTKMVTISPHYIIVNLMSVPLLYRQSRAKIGEIKDVVTSEEPKYTELEAGESRYFHWPEAQCNKHLIITRSDGEHEWSGPFAIDDVGDVTLKLRHRHKREPTFPRTEVIDSPTSVFVLIHPEDPAPPFIIENFTDRSIRYQQENGVHTDSLGPGERVSYAWDEPLDAHALLIDYWGEKGEHGRMRCKISKIVPFKPLKVEQQTVYGYMHVSGPTRVLTLTHDRELYESQGTQWDGTSGAEQGEWDISLNIPGIGISLVDSTPKELLLLSIHGISAMYAKSNIYTTAEIVFDFMQIDNQLPQTDYPVLLYHTKPKDVNEKHRPFLHFSFVRRMNVELNFFEYAGLLVQEINVMIEDSLLNSLLDMFLILSRQLKNNLTFSQSRNTKAAKKKKALYTSTPQSGNIKMIYFKLLHLNPIKVVLSFTFVPDGILSQSSGVLGNFGMTFGQLERAPICLNALLLEHPFTQKRPLVSRIKAHYIRQALNQLYKAVGSSETFGNPVGLFNNLGTGFKDFFYEPAQGFVRSPQEFGRGLAKGSISLLKHSVYGLFNTISKITGAFGKGLALLSLDPEYLNHRRTSERKQPKHLGEGLMMGAQGLGLGIFDGVTGVVRKPIEGALHSGPSGFAKGVVQGVVGVAVKPAAGVMDLATKTTEGIKNTTNLFKTQRRVRPPRAFAKGKVLIEYSLDESEGRYILDSTSGGQFKHDSHLYTMRHGKFISVITNERILGVQAKNYAFIFQVPFEAIKRVEMVKQGVKLWFYEPQPILLFIDRREKYTIEIADKDQILLLCIMLRDCIRAVGM